MGHNELSILNMSGRMSVDLLKVIMRSYNLGSYKLDNVSAHFIRGYIKKFILLMVKVLILQQLLKQIIQKD